MSASHTPFLALLTATAFSLPAFAQSPAEPMLVAGEHRVALTPEALVALPPAEASASFLSSRGFSAGHYKGALLWDLLRAEEIVGDDVKPALLDTILVTAADGHAVAFSVGELSPDFGDTPVMLAWELDGAAPEGGLQMAVPGDKRGARYIKQVVSIEYR